MTYIRIVFLILIGGSVLTLLFGNTSFGTSDEDKKNPKTLGDRVRAGAGKILQDNWQVLAVMFIGNLLIWYSFRPWWILMAKNPMYWFDHGVFLLIFFLLRKKDKKEHPSVYFLLFILIVCNGKELYDWKEWESSKGQSWAQTVDNYSSGKTSSNKQSPFRTVSTEEMKSADQQNIKKAREFFTAEGLPPADVETFVRICVLESGCREFEEDGVTVKQRKPTPDNPDTTPTGAWQIKSEVWKQHVEQQKVKPEFHLKTFEGNMKFALYIYRLRVAEGKTGFEDWPATSGRGSNPMMLAGASTEVTPTIALADTWGEFIPTHGHELKIFPIKDKGDYEFQINDENGPLYFDSPKPHGGIMILPPAKTIHHIRFRGKGENVPVKFEILPR